MTEVKRKTKPKTERKIKPKIKVKSKINYTLHTNNPKVKFTKIVSIDPGIVNYALRIEDRTQKGKIKTVVMLRKNFETFNDDLFVRVNKFFETYHEEFATCTVLIIESQLNFIKCDWIRIFQHTITYFMLKYPDISIVEISSKAKGKVLGWQKDISPPLKKWSVIKALELLNERGDNKGIKIIEGEDKKDDVSDTVCQIEALIIALKK